MKSFYLVYAAELEPCVTAAMCLVPASEKKKKKKKRFRNVGKMLMLSATFLFSFIAIFKVDDQQQALRMGPGALQLALHNIYAISLFSLC